MAPMQLNRPKPERILMHLGQAMLGKGYEK